MSTPTERRDLAQAIDDRMRDLSTWTVLFHESVAARLGLNSSDHKCLDLLLRGDTMTAGDLARRSGLTTGAVTGVIDRLSALGFVRRVKDASDRRRVVIEPRSRLAGATIGPLFAGISNGTRALLAEFKASELRVIQHFVDGCIALARSEVEKPSLQMVSRKSARMKPRGRTGK